jgi:hypothetical protein
MVNKRGAYPGRACVREITRPLSAKHRLNYIINR